MSRATNVFALGKTRWLMLLCLAEATAAQKIPREDGNHLMATFHGVYDDQAAWINKELWNPFGPRGRWGALPSSGCVVLFLVWLSGVGVVGRVVASRCGGWE